MYEYRVKEVVRVIDGDTVDIVIDLGFGIYKRERVRVAGVDTPEIRTRNERERMLGDDAADFADAWFRASGIVVKTRKEDKYGRTLGWFYREHECFNTRLIDEGYAWPYLGGTRIGANDMGSLMLLLNKRGYDTWEDYAEQ